MKTTALEFFKYVHNDIPVLVAKQDDNAVGLEIWVKPRGFYSIRNGVVKPFDDNCKHIDEDEFCKHFTFAIKSIGDTIGFDFVNTDND